MPESPIKTLHIIDSGGMYGAEMMLLNLTREQSRMGVTPCIASIGEKGVAEKPIETRAMAAGIQVQRFRMRPGPNLIGAAALLDYAEREQFSIVHSHGYKGNILLGLMPKHIRRIPVITTVHGYTANTKGLSKIRAYEWLDKRALPRLDGVVLVNRDMLGNPAFKNVSRKNLYVVDNGIATETVSQPFHLDPKILQFCDYPFVIGAVGRLSAEKGIHVLLDALSSILQSGLPARLVIIGDGPLRSALSEKARKLGIETNILMTGFLDNASDYLNSFNILAIPSFTEGLPIVLLEAMRAGTPVVATQVGGIPNVLTHRFSGILVPPGNITALADGIRVLYTDKMLCQQLGKNSKAFFLEKYTSKKMAKKYLAVYGEVIRRIKKRTSVS